MTQVNHESSSMGLIHTRRSIDSGGDGALEADRGGEDMEESPPRVRQDEEAASRDDTPLSLANANIIERRAINQPYASISPVKNVKSGFTMMYRN